MHYKLIINYNTLFKIKIVIWSIKKIDLSELP
jgi:hypothetical protein